MNNKHLSHTLAAWSIAVVALLVVCMAFVVRGAYRLRQGEEAIKSSQQHQVSYEQAVRFLTLGSVMLTDASRRFVATGDRDALRLYFHEAKEARCRERSFEILEDLPKDPGLELLFTESKQKSDTLMGLELRAMKLASRYWKIPLETLPADLRATILQPENDVLTGEALRAKMMDLVFGKPYDQLQKNIIEKGGLVVETVARLQRERLEQLMAKQNTEFRVTVRFMWAILLLACMLFGLAYSGARLRHKMAREAARSREQIFENMPYPVMAFSPEGKILQANAAVEKSLGMSVAEIVGRRCRDVFCTGDARPEWCPLIPGAPDVVDQIHTRPDGTSFMISARHVYDDAGRLAYILETVLDVTKRHQESLNAQALEQGLSAVLADEMLKHPDEILEIVRERLDADLCYLVLDVGANKDVGSVPPGFVALRDGRTNEQAWSYNMAEALELNAVFGSGEIFHFSDYELGLLKHLYRNTAGADVFNALETVYERRIFVNGEMYGILSVAFNDVRRLTDVQTAFLRRCSAVLEAALDRRHTYNVIRASNESLRFKDDLANYLYQQGAFVVFRDYVALKLLAITGAQHVLMVTEQGEREDWFSENASLTCRECARGRKHEHLPDSIFAKGDVYIMRDAQKGKDLGLGTPDFCPAKCNVFRQLRRPEGWWRIVVDFTETPRIALEEVASCVSIAFDLLSVAYDREVHTKTIDRQMAEAQEMNRQLTAERDRVVAAEKARSLFFSTISHDIRTPLNAIIGFSELLKGGIDDAGDRGKALESIVSSGHLLLGIVNDVLDISQLDAQSLRLKLDLTDVPKLASEVLHSFDLKVKDGTVTLREEFADLPPLFVDPRRVRQLLFNLIGNAVKFTKTGSVTVKASFTPGGPRSVAAEDGTMGGPRSVAAEDGTTDATERVPPADPTQRVPPTGTLVLAVVDTGCGISAENRQKILQPFFQVSQFGSLQGAGLGLTVCTQLLKLMGGTLDISSELGQGSTFTITLPGIHYEEVGGPRSVAAEDGASGSMGGPRSVAAEDGASDATERVPPNGRRVLIADDAPLNLVVLKNMLLKLGIGEVVTAKDGAEALETLRADARGFDLVLTDLWMPNLDGNGLARAIRAEAKWRDLPLYAVTADVEAQKTYQQTGFTGLLLKPVTIAKLQTILG